MSASKANDSRISLEQWLHDLGRAPLPDELFTIFDPVLQHLHLSHLNGVFYRDLSPWMIQVDRSGKGSLDEGAGRESPDAANAYLAPEVVASDDRSIGPWTDIYSVAASIHRAVTGHAPASASHPSNAGHSTGLASAMPGIYSKSFAAAIENALVPSLIERPKSVERWRNQLWLDVSSDRSQASDGVRNISPAASLSSLERPEKERGWLRPLAFLAAILIQGLIIAALYFYWPSLSIPGSNSSTASPAEISAWRAASAAGDRQSLEQFIRTWPQGPFAKDAKKRLSKFVMPLTRAQEAQLRPRDEFEECVQCPKMVVIPSGHFMMGSSIYDIGSNQAPKNEGPQHDVRFDAPFAVGKFEITFAEWDECVADDGCRGYRPGDSGWGRGNRPVMNVSWEDAKLYAKWLSGRTGQDYRLLSEAEWEYVARAGSTTKYFFGDEAKSLCRFANVADESGSADRIGARGFSTWLLCYDGYVNTAPVGSFVPNAFGLHDVYGNVSEWTEDNWHDDYFGAPSDGTPWKEESQPFRVARGGSFFHLQSGLTSTYRFKYSSNTQGTLVGFRVARTFR